MFGTFNVIDEYTTKYLIMCEKRKRNSMDVINALTDLFILRGAPAFIHPDNSPMLVAEAARRWIETVGAKTAYIELGSP